MRTVVTKNLSKNYGRDFVLRDINLQVCEGEFLGLVGQNGVGKTTLLRLISGLIQPSSGEAFILGYPVSDAKKISNFLGVVHQDITLPDYLTVHEYLRNEATLRGLGEESVSDALSLAGLDPLINKRMINLSKGSQRKVLIVKALMHNPRVLLLDEPTVGVDPVVRRWIWNYLLRKKEMGISCLISTHYLDEVNYLCDRVLLMKTSQGESLNSGIIDLKKESIGRSICIALKRADPITMDQISIYFSQEQFNHSFNLTIIEGGLRVATQNNPLEVLPFITNYLIKNNIDFTGIWIDKNVLEETLFQYCSYEDKPIRGGAHGQP